MKEIIRKNFVLVLGVSLPVLLVGAVLAFHTLSRMTEDPPAHAVLYVFFESYVGINSYHFDIGSDGRLKIGFTQPKAADSQWLKDANATLVLFDARTETLNTFDLEAPKSALPGQRMALETPDALSALRFNDNVRAPDGYQLELSGYRGGGLLRALFGGADWSRHHRLVKNNVSFRVPGVGSNNYGYHGRFIGWALDRHE